MNLFSMRTRRKLWDYGLTVALAVAAVVVQTAILNNFPVQNVYCNLPLTIVIVWGSVFGSRLPPISPDELRVSSMAEIFVRQLASGSWSGALFGALVGAIFAPMIPIYPLYLPVAGWVAGYFCLRNINSQMFLCMPVVLIVTLIAETIMAWQLSLTGRTGVFENLMQVALPEATLNTIIAPFIYFPMRRYYDLRQIVRTPVET